MGAEIPESKKNPQQFVNISGKIFDWKEAVVTNVKQMARMAENRWFTACDYTATFARS